MPEGDEVAGRYLPHLIYAWTDRRLNMLAAFGQRKQLPRRKARNHAKTPRASARRRTPQCPGKTDAPLTVTQRHRTNAQRDGLFPRAGRGADGLAPQAPPGDRTAGP